MKADKDFAYLADDIARLKKSLASKSVSLNEAERRRSWRRRRRGRPSTKPSFEPPASRAP